MCKRGDHCGGNENMINLVTGGAGFIGSNICDALIDKGQKVVCVDNLSSGRISNIVHLLQHPNFEFIKHDIVQKFDFGRVDRIYNFACLASPVMYQKFPIETLKVCTEGIFNILEVAKRYGSRIFHASTSEVYGDPTVSPQSEIYNGNVNINGPRSCYDEGKRVAETILMEAMKSYCIDIKVGRIFNTYGPRMVEDDGRVVTNFIYSSLSNVGPVIYGDGFQTRSFCYIDDMVNMILKFTELNFQVTPTNIGNPEEVTIKQLANIILSLVGKSLKITYLPSRTDDPVQRCPDITKLKSLIEIPQMTDLNHGISQILKEIRNA